MNIRIPRVIFWLLLFTFPSNVLYAIQALSPWASVSAAALASSGAAAAKVAPAAVQATQAAPPASPQSGSATNLQILGSQPITLTPAQLNQLQNAATSGGNAVTANAIVRTTGQPCTGSNCKKVGEACTVPENCTTGGCWHGRCHPNSACAIVDTSQANPGGAIANTLCGAQSKCVGVIQERTDEYYLKTNPIQCVTHLGDIKKYDIVLEKNNLIFAVPNFNIVDGEYFSDLDYATRHPNPEIQSMLETSTACANNFMVKPVEALTDCVDAGGGYAMRSRIKYSGVVCCTGPSGVTQTGLPCTDDTQCETGLCGVGRNANGTSANVCLAPAHPLSSNAACTDTRQCPPSQTCHIPAGSTTAGSLPGVCQ